MTDFQKAVQQVVKNSKKKLKDQYQGVMGSMSPTACQLKTHREEVRLVQ